MFRSYCDGDASYHAFICMYIIYIFCVYRASDLAGDLALATGYVCYWRAYNEKSSSCKTCKFEAAAALIVTYVDVKAINEANADVSSTITAKSLIWGALNHRNEMFLVSGCSYFCVICWGHVLSCEWSCSWNSADRRWSNYIWVINNFIAFQGAYFIRDFRARWRYWQLGGSFNSLFGLARQKYQMSALLSLDDDMI